MTSKEVWRKSDKGLLRGLFFLVWEGKWADDPESECVLIPAELAFACGDWFICVGGEMGRQSRIRGVFRLNEPSGRRAGSPK